MSFILDFIGDKGEGGAGENWSYKMGKTPQSNRHHQQTNIQRFTGRMPFCVTLI